VSTDFQRAREALGVRLREMRAEGGLAGRELADRLGWTQSKVSKLETGKQIATADDLQTWAEGTERPEAAEELKARLRGLESRSRSWRRQLAAGHRSVQDTLSVEYERSTVLRAWEGSMIVGVLQTAEYARHVFSGYVDLHQSPRDIDGAVRARALFPLHMLRQRDRLMAALGHIVAQVDRLDELVPFGRDHRKFGTLASTTRPSGPRSLPRWSTSPARAGHRNWPTTGPTPTTSSPAP